MAKQEYIQSQIWFGSNGYLDAKMQPVANLSELNNKFDKFTDLSEGMCVTVLNDGTDGEPHDYVFHNNVWVRKDTQILEEISKKTSKEYVDAEISRVEAEIPDVSGKADITYVDEKIEEVEGKIPSIENLATKEELNKKENIITDLDEIREGAAAGKTALQKSDIVDNLESLDPNKPISARAVNEEVINYIDASISDTMRYIDQQDASEHAGRVAGDNLLSDRITLIEGKEEGWDAKYEKPELGIPKSDLSEDVQASLAKADTAIQDISGKVDKEIEGAKGTAQIFNEQDGGGAHFKHNDGSESFVGVNDGGKDGMMAQIYADVRKDGKWSGSRINVYNDKIYYQNQQATDAGKEKNAEELEIAVKADTNVYTSLKKVKEYEYEVVYNSLDYEYAQTYFEENNTPISGSCSAMRQGGFVGRNYDWKYDHVPSFIIRTPNCQGHKAVIGTASNLSGLTRDVVESRKYSSLYKILPFRLLDGINEDGLMIEDNVVPSQGNTQTVPTVEKRERISAHMLLRYMLDKFSTVDEAVDYVKKYVEVYFPTEFGDAGYDLHWMLSDSNKSVVMEVINNAIIVTEQQIMTNFHVNGVTFKEDGSVYTNVDAKSGVLPTTKGIDAHGSGLERYNKLNAIKESIVDAESMREAMNSIFYSNAYTITEPLTDVWCSEFVGKYGDVDVTVDEPYDSVVMQKCLEGARKLWEERSRETGKVWQTCHSCVYDLQKKAFYISVQEDPSEVYYVTFDEDYATKEWVKEQGYLTEHQSLAEYAKTEYVDEKFSEVPNYALREITPEEGYVAEYKLAKNGLASGISIKIPEVKSPVLEQELTTEITVGYVPSGTTFAVGTSIESILRQIFVAPPKYFETFKISVDTDDESSLIGSGVTITVNDVVKTWEGTELIFEVLDGEEYSIVASNVEGYITPEVITGVAVGQTETAITMTYNKKLEPDYIYRSHVMTQNEMFNAFDSGLFEGDEGGPYITHFTNGHLKAFATTGVCEVGDITYANPSNDLYVYSIAIPAKYKVEKAIYLSEIGDQDFTDELTKQENVVVDGEGAYDVYSYIVESGISPVNYKISISIK